MVCSGCSTPHATPTACNGCQRVGSPRRPTYARPPRRPHPDRPGASATATSVDALIGHCDQNAPRASRQIEPARRPERRRADEGGSLLGALGRSVRERHDRLSLAAQQAPERLGHRAGAHDAPMDESATTAHYHHGPSSGEDTRPRTRLGGIINAVMNYHARLNRRFAVPALVLTLFWAGCSTSIATAAAAGGRPPRHAQGRDADRPASRHRHDGRPRAHEDAVVGRIRRAPAWDEGRGTDGRLPDRSVQEGRSEAGQHRRHVHPEGAARRHHDRAGAAGRQERRASSRPSSGTTMSWRGRGTWRRRRASTTPSWCSSATASWRRSSTGTTTRAWT